MRRSQTGYRPGHDGARLGDNSLTMPIFLGIQGFLKDKKGNLKYFHHFPLCWHATYLYSTPLSFLLPQLISKIRAT